MIILICKKCKKNYKVYPYRKKSKYCSFKCRNMSMLGKKAFHWTGGKRKHSKGYVYIYSPFHPYKDCNDVVLEHRLIMEKWLSRYLLPGEVVHHINKKPNDNRIKNLMLFPNDTSHKIFHKELRNGKRIS
jgi:hypothetical protein